MTVLEHLLAEIELIDREIDAAGTRGFFDTEKIVADILCAKWLRVSAIAKAMRAVDETKTP